MRIFGRGRPKQIAKVEPTEIDDDDEDEEEAVEETPALVTTPKAKIIEQKKTTKCKIIEGTLLEDGAVRYTIAADSSIGEIGDEFEF